MKYAYVFMGLIFATLAAGFATRVLTFAIEASR